MSFAESRADIVVTECPSECGRCTGVYINEVLRSKIICRCLKCRHYGRVGKALEARFGIAATDAISACEPSSFPSDEVHRRSDDSLH